MRDPQGNFKPRFAHNQGAFADFLRIDGISVPVLEPFIKAAGNDSHSTFEDVECAGAERGDKLRAADGVESHEIYLGVVY
ncbi:MAG: hypothetical protein CFE26_11115 [Verrucomicrobiales bacterium VVV1]|nr:MAG: hypothetical protein CFE26_11115 [Verrucomicrobiales bacterium VVV1]